jgi:hypothetical protein
MRIDIPLLRNPLPAMLIVSRMPDLGMAGMGVSQSIEFILFVNGEY